MSTYRRTIDRLSSGAVGGAPVGSARRSRAVEESSAMGAHLIAARADLSWSLEPTVLAAVVLAGALYASRWRRVRTAASPRASADAPVWRLCCFFAALAAT